MDKTIERDFFKAFEFGGVVCNCIDYFRKKYDLGFYPQKSTEEKDKRLSELTSEDRESIERKQAKWNHIYNTILPEDIKKKTADFDSSVIEYGDSSLIKEIESNLNEIQDDKKKERYIFSLLIPFKEYSDTFNPEGLIRQFRGEVEGIEGISDCESYLAMWENLPKKDEESKMQIEACRKSIEYYKNGIDRVKFISNRFRIILNETNCEHDTVESCLGYFHWLACRFADRLDALLLEQGINLLWYQQECGIYLKSRRNITDVSHYIGSYELARKYIDEALPKLENQQNEDITLPKELNTDEAKSLFQKIEYCATDGDLYRWTGTASLFGYFVDLVSDALNVRPSNGRIPWKIFKIAFQRSDSDIATAKQAINGYKQKGLSEPEGFLDIKNACK